MSSTKSRNSLRPCDDPLDGTTSFVMNIDRMARVNALLKREIGQILFRVMNEPDFDIAAITVTGVSTSRNLRHARVGVSVRADEERRREMLSLIKRHRIEIQREINANLKLKYTPRLTFELDESLAKGDGMLNLLLNMEHEEREKQAEEGTEDQG